jgi:Protein of unknown function (DUF2442)
MKKIARIPRVTRVEVRPPYGLHLTFDDGVTRDVELADDLWGPMFEPLKDPAFFAQVSIDHGTVVWPNGLDLDPLVLHGDFKPAARRAERHVG